MSDGKTFSYSKTITAEDVDNLMCAALEGGINYWCDGMEVVNEDYKGAEWGHEVLTRGGSLLLKYEDGDDQLEKELTLEKLLAGLGQYNYDPDNADAGDADNVVQLAIFGEIVYG